ncbi:citrate synthase [Candidatus Sumerlaeota bacterium]|nr:citrate synthase [Candidatus Sumerlaeota bacterium]
MPETCKLNLDGKEYELPVVTGTENEKAIDISKLRATTGYITLDDGFANTGSCQSSITYIDGEKGILRYRGYPVEQLAENCTFTEVAYLLIFGELPDEANRKNWWDLLTEHELLHEDMRHHFEGFPATAHPMAILSAMINANSCFYPHLMDLDDETFVDAAARIVSKVRTISAFAYRKSMGLPRIYPRPDYSYTANFLHMMFSLPNKDYDLRPEVVKALSELLILHADHEQNCSTSTVRMVGSAQANLFASVAAGVCALWGSLHGGANQQVLEMLQNIRECGESLDKVVERAKDKSDPFRLYGFGHRVYKNFDPRAKIIKKACDELLEVLHIDDPLLDIAKRLEEVALSDEYFIERKLYPNVDFYSGIILRAIGIPLNMFTVMFAIGRVPGWVAHWREVHTDPSGRIYRPRQVYQGENERSIAPLEKRGA